MIQILLIAVLFNSGVGEIFLNHNYNRILRKSHGTIPQTWRYETSASNNIHQGDTIRANPKPLVISSSSSVESIREDGELTDETRWKFAISPTERAHNPWHEEKKNVKIHIYRGPNEKYIVLKHKPESKYFAPWGYFVSQPIGSYKGQPNHELSFHYS